MKKNSNGQMLIEVLIALTVVTMVALGLVKATTSSVKNTGYSKDQNQAMIIGQKKIADIVALKNSNPGAFFTTLPPFFENDTTYPPFCVKALVSTAKADLPTTTPNYLLAQMARITVDVYWGEKDSGVVNCKSKVYGSTEHFETYVTN